MVRLLRRPQDLLLLLHQRLHLLLPVVVFIDHVVAAGGEQRVELAGRLFSRLCLQEGLLLLLSPEQLDGNNVVVSARHRIFLHKSGAAAVNGLVDFLPTGRVVPR